MKKKRSFNINDDNNGLNRCIYQKYTLNKFQTYIGISGPSSEHNNISIDGKFIYINDSYYIIINNTKVENDYLFDNIKKKKKKKKHLSNISITKHNSDYNYP